MPGSDKKCFRAPRMVLFNFWKNKMWLTPPSRCISMWCDAVISILQSQTLPLTNLQVPICLDCTFVFIKKNTFSVFATTLSFQVFWLFLFRDWRSIQRPGAPAADQALSCLNWRSTWTSISWRLAWTSTVRNGSRKRKWIWSRSWTKTKLWQRHSMAKKQTSVAKPRIFRICERGKILAWR